MFAHLRLHFNKTENVFHVTTQIFGIMTEKNVRAAPRHTFITKIAEDASVQTIYHLILELNAFNVSSQVTGTQIKEDVFNVQTSKSMTESEEFALPVPRQLHSLKITNATVVHKTHITTRPG